MTITAQSMITTAYRRLTGVSGYTLTSNEQTDFLPVLNAMMDSWSTERIMCYQILQENFTLTSSTASYTIGSGATWNTTRPTKIVDPCFIRDSNNLDFPVAILQDSNGYGKLSVKTVTSPYPTHLFYDTAYSSSGYATVWLWPTPSAANTIYINSWKQLQQFSAISTAILLPPGYQRAIEWNLCLELADEIGRDPSANMARQATLSLKYIKSLNLPDPIMRVDKGAVQTPFSRGNIYLGP